MAIIAAPEESGLEPREEGLSRSDLIVRKMAGGGRARAAQN